MNDLLPSVTASASKPSGPSLLRTGASAPLLVIGTQNLPDKEQLVLRSLIRLLDGSGGLRLRYVESLADCNVVFVGGDDVSRLPLRCVTIPLVGSGKSPTTGLMVAPPLRITNVLAVLHLAESLLTEASATSASGDDGLAALFQILSHNLLTRERRVTVLPLHDGRHLIVDFARDRMHTPLLLDELLAGHYRLGETRRASQPERELAQLPSSLSLRELVWRAALRLSEESATPPALQGRVLLRRWPDALVLSRPGMPRLCAQLTRRALDVSQAAADADMSPLVVQWFMYAALMLGIAVIADDHAAAQLSTQPLRELSESRSLLSRLRERLKLW